MAYSLKNNLFITHAGRINMDGKVYKIDTTYIA